MVICLGHNNAYSQKMCIYCIFLLHIIEEYTVFTVICIIFQVSIIK